MCFIPYNCMIENYKNSLISYHTRFLKFLEERGNLILQDKVDHDQMARLVRNWMLETNNLLQYVPPAENKIESDEERETFNTFILDVKASIVIWKHTMEDYTGKMSKKLAESFDINNKLPEL